ncbi:hypothetical protein J1G42_13620 [Cellulomonas sp. zg-ZUI222]|uniref:Uncharacterized protein n=1 Tax=Cellulomonas wangleii TaxID=2816956 RepID=A0ABX8D625_9CELL|nr:MULTISPECIES: hypothetical protein [Cellulomonas]MBO0901417.1 hypothetical protein [Cellulomonas sp. zg-ZUI22]MBO0921863.1 hypothetical protein [Cellulomonas wangleii]MBO0924715.1 hypothetical protein [Cellulomonas wangleii]QVI62901.1 hypothetical protein KG103_02900 [Cellulomonas wangleii]
MRSFLRGLTTAAAVVALSIGAGVTTASAADDPYGGMTVAEFRSHLADPGSAGDAQWAAVERAIQDAGGKISYSSSDEERLLRDLVLSQPSTASPLAGRQASSLAGQGATTFASKVTNGPCTGYPSAPHRRTDTPGAAHYNVGFKPRITCTQSMQQLMHTSVLYRQRATGLVGSDRMAVASGSNRDAASYEDKRPVWNCSSSGSGKWKVIYEYGYQRAGCTCNAVQYFVVQTDFASLSCRGI